MAASGVVAANPDYLFVTKFAYLRIFSALLLRFFSRILKSRCV